MPSLYPPAMSRLINELTKLPSIGERSASRLAYHLLTSSKGDSLLLSDMIREAVESTRLCPICFFLTEDPICAVCADPRRKRSLLCTVEKPADVIAIEKSGGYRGLYHVLHGVWSPLKGLGPEQTRIGDLLRRVRKQSQSKEDPLAEKLDELILATGTTVEGDATALYIANAVEDLEIPITRIAQGLPKGGELEFADHMTLHLSFEGRRKL